MNPTKISEPFTIPLYASHKTKLYALIALCRFKKKKS